MTILKPKMAAFIRKGKFSLTYSIHSDATWGKNVRRMQSLKDKRHGK